MSNALTWAAGIKAAGTVRASAGEGRIAMIHPDDIAGVATHALLAPTWEQQSLVITGPEALTYGEMAAQLAAVLGRPVAFEAISDEQARERLLATGMPAALADGLVGLWRSVREGIVSKVTDTVERVTGRKARTFESWARENVAAFR